MTRIVDIAIFVLFVFSVLFYLESLQVLHSYWVKFTEAYAHGYVVVGMVVYLLFLKRNELFDKAVKGQNWECVTGLIMAAGCSFVWFVSGAVQVQIVQLLSVFILVWLWVVTVYGFNAAIKVGVPFLLLLMAIPLWDGLSLYLRLITVVVVEYLLSFWGVAAYVDGFRIDLAHGVVEVAGSCSGLKYFLAGSCLAIFYAELNFNNLKRKLFIILLGITVAIAANWIRVSALVLVAHYSKMQHSLVYDHEQFGWIVFMVCFAVFVFFGNKISPGKKTSITGVGQNSYDEYEKSSRKLVFAVGFAIVVVIFPIVDWLGRDSVEGKGVTHEYLNDKAREINHVNFEVQYSGFDVRSAWKAKIDHQEIGVDIYTYQKQQQGKELIYYKNKIAEDDVIKSMYVEDVGFDKNIRNVSVVHRGTDSILIAHWFEIGSHKAISGIEAKLMQVPAKLKGGLPASLVVVSYSCIKDMCSASEKKRFLVGVESVYQNIGLKNG